MKQTREPEGRSRFARFPRRNRRGLIEACCARSWRARKSAVFPGEIAGASLKLENDVLAQANVRPFSPAKSPGPH